MQKYPVNVLYVEDDPADVDIAETAMRDVGCTALKINTVDDGEIALNYLRQLHSYKDATRPDLVMLDLNLPKVHGKDVLRAMKADSKLENIPVIILSTSSNQNDVDETYRLGACGYFTKPVNYEDYKATFKLICEYWGIRITLPSSSPSQSA